MNLPPSIMDIVSQADATNAKNAAEVVRLQKALDEAVGQLNCALSSHKEAERWLNGSEGDDSEQTTKDEPSRQELEEDIKGLLWANNGIARSRDEAIAETNRLKRQLYDARIENSHQAAQIEKFSVTFDAEREQHKKDIEEIKRLWDQEVKTLKAQGDDDRADRDEYLDALGIANTKNTQMSTKIKEQALQIQKLSEELERVGRIVGAQNPLSDELLKLVSAMNSSNAGAVKGEPSRLEIAAMLKAGWFANPHSFIQTAFPVDKWIAEADELIAAAKERI